MRTNLRFFNVVLVGVLVLTALLGSTTTPAKAIDEPITVFINEIRIDQTSDDIDEYFELVGAGSTSLDGLTYIVIGDGTGGSGVIESVTDLTGSSLDTDGFFVAAETSFTLGIANLTTNLNFENSDNVTHMLVNNFTGADGDDLDTDDDGVFDIEPWSTIVDSIALVETTTEGEKYYGGKTVGPDGTFVPGHAYNCSNKWEIGDFVLGMNDTPGEINPCSIMINEIRTDQTGTDYDEYFEIVGAANASITNLTYIVIGEGSGGSGVVEAVVDLDGYYFDADGHFVVAEETFTLGAVDKTSSLNFENSDNVTHLLVEGFTGSNGIDLDTNDDGILDLEPWNAIVDGVSLVVDPSATTSELFYSQNIIGPNGTYVPAHVYKCLGNWIIGSYDSLLKDTPGLINTCENQGISASCPFAISILPGDNVSESFTARDVDGVVVNAEISSASVIGITLENIIAADGIDRELTGDLVIADTTPEGFYEIDITFSNTDLPDAQTKTCTVPITVSEPVGVCLGDTRDIGMVQGEGLATPLEGVNVIISGVVTSVYQGTGELGGFFLQDTNGDGNDLTSDGIFIYSSTSVTEGDIVQVTGTASERYGNTQISAGTVSQCAPVSVDLPTTVSPVSVSFPLTAQSDLEYYEGMLVTFPQDLTISEYFNFDRYGELVLSNGRFLTHTAISEPSVTEASLSEAEYQRNKIVLDDGRTTQNPDPAYHPNGFEFTLDNLFRGGDTVQNVTGTIYYDFNLYRVAPTTGADYTSTNPRTSAHEAVGGSLKVASFNVLNYFTTLGSRGADTAEEFTRQRDKIIAAIAAIDADVVGLIEIENNTEAIADLVNGLNAYLSPGTYAYVDTGVIGTDEIKVAFIYKPATVSLVGDYEILDSSVDSRFIDTKNRPVLAQTFQETATGGVFTVAVNHLKSKGSVCDGDPDLGDGAGNCNLTRTAAAEALVDWLNGDPTGSGDPDFLIIGDLNSYDKEDPIDAILEGADDTLSTTDDYTDLIFNFVGEDAYSYVFDGRIGYLDHALANQDLFAQVSGTTIWHINADEADLIDYDMEFKQDAQDAIYAPDAYRSSDHDPVIIGLSLDNAIPVADAQNAAVDEDDSVAITLTGSDQETASESLVFAVVDGPSHGVLTGTAPNLTYEPDANYNGPDSFSFTVSDGINTSMSAVVSITVNPVNDNPVAVSDSYEVVSDTTLNVNSPGVLTNDSDIDGDSLDTNLVNDTVHGTLSLNSDGSFTYTPEVGYVGLDMFTYKATDGELESEYVTVTITVIPGIPVTNTPPVADAQTVSVVEDSSLAIELTGSDAETASGELVFAVVVPPTHGTLTGTSPNLTYEPDADYNGSDSFTFTVSDGELTSESAIVSITVNPVNDNPVAVSDSGESYAVVADQVLIMAAPGVLTNDGDVDGDELEAVLVEDVLHGTLTLNSDGSFTYDPNDDYVGMDTFTYKASDGELESNIVTVTITVIAVPVTGSEIFIYLPIIFR